MGVLPMTLNWKVNCVMESIIFDYIGYVLIFCAALCVATPLLVHVVSLAVGVIWKIIDEGDSESPDLLEKVMPFLYSSGKIVARGSMFVVVNAEGKYYDPSDGKFWSECFFGRMSTIEAAEAVLKEIPEQADFKYALGLSVILTVLGAGFISIPTITMYALSSALCLLSLRWSRRGYKKVKKLKIALDEHTKNKEAHK